MAMDFLLSAVLGATSVSDVAMGHTTRPLGLGFDLVRYLALGAACLSLPSRGGITRRCSAAVDLDLPGDLPACPL